jgi:allantoin racemase
MFANWIGGEEVTMSTKILWLSDNLAEHWASDPDEQEIICKNMLAYAQSVARPTTEFVLDFVDRNVGREFALWSPYPRAFVRVEILERIKQAEVDGFDAAFPGMCFGEFFLQDARQAVRMPVVGAAESSMLLAQMLGMKFAVVTVAPRFENIIWENIRLHGWESRAIRDRPVRSWISPLPEMMVDAYQGHPDRLIEEFDRQAQECVKDGADVVICGCNPYGAALGQVGYKEVIGTGVPVVTPMAAQIKLAEHLVDVRRSTGLTKSEAENGPYYSTPSQILDDLVAHGVGIPELRQSTEPQKKQRNVA